MTNEHPITPPPELVQQWFEEASKDGVGWPRKVANAAAQWGADQELEACCKVLEVSDRNAREFLYSARRPKPPSLKEQALETLQRISEDKYPCNYQEDFDWDIIRRALEALPDA